MPNRVEIASLIREALAAENPEDTYSRLVDQGLGDVSDLTTPDILLLAREFSKNSCVLMRAFSPEQRRIIYDAIVNGYL